MTAVERRFATMGCTAGVWLQGPLTELELGRSATRVIASIEGAAATLSRFDPESELSRLNAEPRRRVEASPLLRAFVRAVRQAGASSDGRVDATLLRDIEDVGYATSRAGTAPVALPEALAAAPARRPAGPSRRRDFERCNVEGTAIVRPAGVRLDSGGLGKGLAADRAATLVPEGVTYAIAIGGDLAVGGPEHQPVDVTRAGGSDVVHRLHVRDGGVATSGLHQRLWFGDDGAPAHHLLDPATGRPAWTGLLAVTAVGTTAVDAEVLAKAAFLGGEHTARRLLRRAGGVVQHESGRVEVIAPAPIIRVPRQRLAA